MKSFISLLAGILIILGILTGCTDIGSNNNPTANDDDDNDNTASWTTDTIFTTGKFPSMTLDTSGNPFISFLDYSDGYVKYTYRSGDSWIIEPVGKVSNQYGTFANGGVSNIALDGQNNPYITYYDYGNVQFKLASKKGGVWSTNPIPLPNDPKMSYDSPFIPWEESSIAIDKTSGVVHVALHMLGGLSSYVLGYWRSGMTAALIVDDSDGQTGYNNSIALDSKGWPAITYEARGSGELKYAKWNGSGFDIENIAAIPEIYWMEHLSSLDIDVADVSHAVFYGQGGYKYAVKDGVSWIIKDIIYQSTYPALSLCLDSNNVPQIVILSSSSVMKHAFLSDSDWSYDDIDKNISHCVIKTAPAGKMYVAYETDMGILKYAFK